MEHITTLYYKTELMIINTITQTQPSLMILKSILKFVQLKNQWKSTQHDTHYEL